MDVAPAPGPRGRGELDPARSRAEQIPAVAPPKDGLGAELRESLVLLGVAVAVTVGLTTAAQAAFAALS